jgi:hypothetical protein
MSGPDLLSDSCTVGCLRMKVSQDEVVPGCCEDLAATRLSPAAMKISKRRGCPRQPPTVRGGARLGSLGRWSGYDKGPPGLRCVDHVPSSVLPDWQQRIPRIP